MKRKQSIYKGLQFQPVWFEDRSLTSPDYFQISEFPTRLTAGKNLFKLRGHPTNLKVNSTLNIEILDYNNNPIYFEILNYLDDDKSRVISIHVYDDTPAGDCSITIIAEAENVPENWKGIPNIKWSRSVSVNPNTVNDSEIIFETVPTVTITEQIGPHLDRIYSGSIQFPTINTGTVKYFSYNGQPAIELSGSKFTKDMSTGTIVINTPINPAPTPLYTPDTIKFTSGIKKVLSPTLALLDTEYEVYTSASLSSHKYYSFEPSSYSLTYESTPTYVETQNSESYALVEIKGLQPNTGDVSRIKMFMNNKGTVGTWELINDVELEETEIFVTSTASLYPDQSIGSFISQNTIDTYWEGHTYQGANALSAPTLTWNTSSLNNAMQITNAIDISQKNAVSIVQTKPVYNGFFIENSDYKVTFDALGIKTGTDAILSVYMSGSAFTLDYTDYLNQELPKTLGKRIGQINVNGTTQRFDDIVFKFTSDNTGNATLLFVIESGNWQIADIRTTSDNDTGFTPNYTRIKTLVPTAHKANNQLTFKAEYYNVAGVKSKQISYVYNKTWEGGNRYIDGNYSMLTGSLYVADSLQTGVAISGYKNTGFLRSLGYEGFEAGFPGFLMWSGSALSGSLGTKGSVPYSGVGLELYANPSNYFRYSTTDSELDIRTDTVFIGNSSTSFISASNGNLQISSSNFSIAANGSVTLTGAINITGGSGFATPASVTASINSATSSVSASLSDRIVTDSANKIIKPNNTPGGGQGLYLSEKYLGYYDGSNWNAYISSSGAFLFKQNNDNLISFDNNSFILKISDTATISGSNINLVTPKFFFGNDSNFISGSDGNIKISGSNVSVETPKFFLGDKSTQYVSGSNGLLEISSSNFHLKSNGEITASGIDITGVSKRNIIQDKTIVITALNSSSYITDVPEVNGGYPPQYIPAYQILCLDGSLPGGEKVQRVELRFNSPIKTGTSGSTSVTYPVAIGGIKLPQIGSNNQVTCIIEIASGSVVYMNNSVGSFRNWFDYSYPTYVDFGGDIFDGSYEPVGPGWQPGGGMWQ